MGWGGGFAGGVGVESGSLSWGGFQVGVGVIIGIFAVGRYFL